VEAKTPVTAGTFSAWHSHKVELRRIAREEKEAERRKKGALNGREIFMQVRPRARAHGWGRWGAGSG